MKITKEMVHPELRPKFHILTISTWLISKRWGVKLLNLCYAFAKGRTLSGLDCQERFIPSRCGGPNIRLRIVGPLNRSKPLPCMLYFHPGGYLFGNPESVLDLIKQFINTRPCIVIAPDYRKSLQAPYPAAFDDCYDSLLWAKEHAQTLGIDASKFMLAGHSAGGGITAAVTLKVKDTQDINIAFQMPIYPMIDDQQMTESARDMTAPVWNTRTNQFAWHAYLSDIKARGLDTPIYAAPSRNKDHSGIPPTITFVGDLEPFKDETINYVNALKQQNIHVSFKLFKGCYHAFDLIASKSSIAQQALKFTYQHYAHYYDRYITTPS